MADPIPMTAVGESSKYQGGTFSILAAPNPWSVVLDYGKAITTMATAMLGFTVTFAGSFLAGGVGDVTKWLLFGTWGLLAGSIIFGTMSVISLYRFLRHNTGTEQVSGGASISPPAANRAMETCRLCSTWSFQLFWVAVLAFALMGIFRVRELSGSLDAAQASKRALQFAQELSQKGRDELFVSELFWSESDRTYRVNLQGIGSTNRWTVILNNERIVSCSSN